MCALHMLSIDRYNRSVKADSVDEREPFDNQYLEVERILAMRTVNVRRVLSARSMLTR